MTDYDNTNRGSVWGNEDKTPENPTWADFKGSINIEGVEYWLNAWKRKPDANPKSPSLSFTVKRKESQSGGQQTQSGTGEVAQPTPEGFDDIPF